jgi:hypothetical protein
LPYVVGFHPSESLVLVGVCEGRVDVTARLDLADATIAAIAHTVGVIAAGGARQVVAVVYSDVELGPDGELPYSALVTAVATAVTTSGCALQDMLLVAGDRFWSYLCDTAGCCPAEGRPLDVQGSAIAAEATYAGLVALPDRSSLERSLEPRSLAERVELMPALSRAAAAAAQQVAAGRADRQIRSVKRALFAAARAADSMLTPEPLDCADVVRFGVALREFAVRDPVWLAVDDRRLDGRALWLDLARRLPEPYDAAPLFLFAWASWRDGSGAIARTAAERALASDRQYSAADLLLAALAQGVDPRRLPKLRGRRSA